MKQFIAFTYLILLLTSCVGINVQKKTFFTPKWIKLSETRGVLSRGIPNQEFYNITDVIELWGEADKIETTQKGKKLIYFRGLNWKGAIVYIGIPVAPLIFPFGRNKTILTFENNQLIDATQNYNRNSFYGCAYFDGIYVCGLPGF